jgi:uncharacterized protein YxjI
VIGGLRAPFVGPRGSSARPCASSAPVVRASASVAEIREKKLSIRDSIKIHIGDQEATVKKALVSPLRDRFDVSIEGGGSWDVQGNITAHEYEISDGRQKIAEVSKKWVRIRDTYGIEVQPGQDDALVLAIAVALDEMRRGD